MNDTILQDSIFIIKQATSSTAETGEQTNWWMWLALAESVIIAILIFKEQFKSKDTAKRRFKRESLEQEIDFDNIIKSSFYSTQLYDELKVRCHPDRFPTDKEKNIIAENLFQEISQNKNNVKRLLELKEEAVQKLNINFSK